jgi:hypothetical protein
VNLAQTWACANSGEVATKLAKCEADHEAQIENNKKFEAGVAADREKQRLEAAEEALVANALDPVRTDA